MSEVGVAGKALKALVIEDAFLLVVGQRGVELCTVVASGDTHLVVLVRAGTRKQVEPVGPSALGLGRKGVYIAVGEGRSVSL